MGVEKTNLVIKMSVATCSCFANTKNSGFQDWATFCPIRRNPAQSLQHLIFSRDFSHIDKALESQTLRNWVGDLSTTNNKVCPAASEFKCCLLLTKPKNAQRHTPRFLIPPSPNISTPSALDFRTLLRATGRYTAAFIQRILDSDRA